MSKWKKALRSYEDAVDFKYDAYAKENLIYTPSPYLNWTFANRNHGLPKGATLLLYAENKAGKSLLIQAMAQQAHQMDPEAEIIVFNTEMRGFLQNGLFKGIDPDRFTSYDTSRPEDIFDRIADEIYPMIQDGMKVPFIAIDSLTKVGGTKAEGRSVNDHLVGDKALTVGKGLDRIIPLLKKSRVSLIATEQMRKNVDTNNPHAPKDKLAASWNTLHTFEYIMSLKRAGAAEDKADLSGEKFVNEAIKDARGDAELTSHKVYARMEQSSLGPAGRAGVFTVDYTEGIINQHEEIFLLGYNTGIIKREGNSNYLFGNLKVNGKGNFAKKLQEAPELQAEILEAVKALDKDKN